MASLLLSEGGSGGSTGSRQVSASVSLMDCGGGTDVPPAHDPEPPALPSSSSAEPSDGAPLPPVVSLQSVPVSHSPSGKLEAASSSRITNNELSDTVGLRITIAACTALNDNKGILLLARFIL